MNHLLILKQESLKITFFWNVMPFSLVDSYFHFGRMYSLHLLGRKVDVAQSSLQTEVYYTRSEVLAAVIMKNTSFWNVILSQLHIQEDSN
jgi:hypothetical protein